MARWQHIAVVGLAIAIGVSATAQTNAAPKPTGKRMTSAKHKKTSAAHEKVAAEATPVVQQEVAPPPPSRPYEMPPVAPQVTYNNGTLSISATNSTLADILQQVQQSTGAHVDMPPNTAQERVAVDLSGYPRDVLARLLEGSRFDYLLLGSDTDPRAVTQITITQRTGGASTAVAAGTPIPNRAPMQPEPAEEEDNEAQQAQQGPPAPQPMMQPGQMPEQNQPAQGQMYPGAPTPTPGQTVPGQPQNQAGPKTPEQLLHELQQMQQQEQMRRRQPRPPQ